MTATVRERNFNGYRQRREGVGPWRFYLCGFFGPPLPNGCDSRAHVLMSDGSESEAQMDMAGRVSIRGKWYDHRHWEH